MPKSKIASVPQKKTLGKEGWSLLPKVLGGMAALVVAITGLIALILKEKSAPPVSVVSAPLAVPTPPPPSSPASVASTPLVVPALPPPSPNISSKNATGQLNEHEVTKSKSINVGNVSSGAKVNINQN